MKIKKIVKNLKFCCASGLKTNISKDWRFVQVAFCLETFCLKCFLSSNTLQRCETLEFYAVIFCLGGDVSSGILSG